ncbi:MAG: Gfo/Idh/MocA family oxidoreductase [Bryobacteraceae bacterium]|nr:Gfo/Idh/MocA family oxidoreductase [Bryobacteraceae bacterium]
MPISRRSLIAGVPAAAALAAAAAPGAETVRLPKKIRLAMLTGPGHMAEILDPLPLLPDVELAGVAGSEKELARLAKNKYVAAAMKYGSLTEMLDREKPDVVGLCNDNGGRAAAILECAKRKMHVIAEKPYAVSSADYRKVKQAVKDSGIHVSMLVPMRFEPQFKALKKIVDDGLIGDVIQVSAQKSYKASTDEWKVKRATYGSTILWIGIHMIDLMRWTSGRELVDATAWQTHVGFPEMGDQENVSASVYKLDNGGLAILRMDYLRPKSAPTHGDDRVRLAGTKGVAEYMEATGVTVVTADQKPRVITELPPEGHVLIDFLQGVYEGKPRIVTEADIWRVNELTLAAHESSMQGGETVRLG